MDCLKKEKEPNKGMNEGTEITEAAANATEAAAGADAPAEKEHVAEVKYLPRDYDGLTAVEIEDYMKMLDDIAMYDYSIEKTLDTDDKLQLQLMRRDFAACAARMRARDPRRFAKGDSLVKSIQEGKMDHVYLLGDEETRKRIFSFSPATAEYIVRCAHIKMDAVVNAIVSDPDNNEAAVVIKLGELERGIMRTMYM